MIVGGYKLDLHCDGPPPRGSPLLKCATFKTFIGRDRAEAYAIARRVGWSVWRGRALCPPCIERRRTRPSNTCRCPVDPERLACLVYQWPLGYDATTFNQTTVPPACEDCGHFSPCHGTVPPLPPGRSTE